MGWGMGDAERGAYEEEALRLQGEVRRLQQERLALVLQLDDAGPAHAHPDGTDGPGHGPAAGRMVAAAQRRAALRSDVKRCYRYAGAELLTLTHLLCPLEQR